MTSQQHQPPGHPVQRPSLGQATQLWAKIGVLSFGGPAGQIALMHRELVEDRGWLTEVQFLNATSFCMLLPGPEAMQIATYAGWRLHGTWGGVIAGGLFVVPGALVICALTALYAVWGAVGWLQAGFMGVKAAVVVIVLQALISVARRALVRWDQWGVAGLAFAALYLLALPYPLIVASAALYGALTPTADAAPEPEGAPIVPFRRTLGVITVWLMLWLAPLAVLWLVAPDGLLTQLGLFFSKLAVVTFGGAYAVLAYMAQDVVHHHGWLSAGEMMDGLGLAETTPGPLILVTQFVGQLAAHKVGGVGMALAGAAVTLWVTFTPCFLWIFAGAPYIDRIAAQPRLRGALAGITAAVVGVILYLSLWFALNVMFESVGRIDLLGLTPWWPTPSSFVWQPAILAVIAGFFLIGRGWPLGAVLPLSALGGLALSVGFPG